MRRIVFPIVTFVLCALAAPIQAADVAPVVEAATPAAQVSPDLATHATPAAEPIADAAPVAVARGSKSIVLGPQGVDDQGRVGRLHTVARGDTLWDLSAAYLGTPWVWPSVWTDNRDIANPHRIRPGDRIWITANEMRVVSDDEADAFLSRLVEESEAPASADESDAMAQAETDAAAGDLAPAAPDETVAEATPPVEEPTLAAIAPSSPTGRQITVSRRSAMGFVSEEQMAGASTVLDSPAERVGLTAGDMVYIGLGEGDTQVGDRFTIFEAVDIVRDVGSNRILGYHVDVLGWAEVKQLTGDTSIAEVRMSYSDIRRGARVLARPDVSRHVTVVRTPEAAEGHIVFLPGSTTELGDGGYVYLNRGELDGLEIGSELEVFDRGAIQRDLARAVDVQTPDHNVATIVVVSVEPRTAVAFVLNSSRELGVGDLVRPKSAAQLAAR